MTEGIPYWPRVAALVVLLSAIAAVDLARHGSKATRWREYSFILAGGLAAGLFGLVNDLITSAISPEYFILGKGLPARALRQSAGELGLQAGSSAGVIAAAVMVYAATRGTRRPPFPIRSLCLLTWRPFVLAVGFGVAFPLLLSGSDPLAITSSIEDLLEPSKVARFLMVWWVHLGLYLGLLAGVVWTVLDVAGKRRRGGASGERATASAGG